MGSIITLALHNNRLSGPIPASIGRLTSLEDLLLYNNQLTGQVPFELGEQLPRLRAVLLHKNFLEGQFPGHWRNAERMQALTLHENRFKGSLPSMQNMTMLHYLTVHGNHFAGNVPKLNLPEGARATLHRNRFSCQLPASLGLDARATVVMGNMVGVGESIAVNWVSPAELQDFLYVSSKIWRGNVLVLAGLPVAILGTGGIYFYCQSWQTSARSTQAPGHEIGMLVASHISSCSLSTRSPPLKNKKEVLNPNQQVFKHLGQTARRQGSR